MTGDLTLWLAFSAGLLSFISPCVLPLYPSYLSYITGISMHDLREANFGSIRRTVVFHTFFFILGLSVVYVVLGLSASFFGGIFIKYEDLIRQIGAILVILMGLFLLGWLRFDLLMREKRLELRNKPAGYLGSFLVGISFAAGWTPCIGPILSSILVLAASNPELGLSYILLYSAGFGLPFLLFAFFLGSTRSLLKYSHILVKIGGAVMVVMGILLFTDQLNQITIYLTEMFGPSWFDAD